MMRNEVCAGNEFEDNGTALGAGRNKGTRSALVVVTLCAVAAAQGCKMDGARDDGGSKTKAHFGGQRMTGLLQRKKARMGLYKAVGTQFCPAASTMLEYHVKELENHSPLSAPLWGIVCLAKDAREAQLLDGQGIPLGRAIRQQNSDKVFYEIRSEVGDACNLGSTATNVLAHVTVYEKGLLQKITDWRHRELLGVCASTAGRELRPSAEFVRDFVSPAVFNENWHVVRADEKDTHTAELAKIWTNPAWGSWSVEDLQEGEALVRPTVLYLLPVVQEMKRREASATSSSDPAAPNGYTTPAEP